MKILRFAPSLLAALWLSTPPALAGTEKRVSPSGLSTAWISTGQNLSIELIPVAPDAVRAMYARKNFPKPLLETIAGYCVLGSVIRNETDAEIGYDMTDWHFSVPVGTPRRPRTKDEWLAIWRENGVDFSYSLLPTTQAFEPGDWGQGMITLELPRGAIFDFTYTWTQRGRRFSATLEGVQCAKDSPP